MLATLPLRPAWMLGLRPLGAPCAAAAAYSTAGSPAPSQAVLRSGGALLGQTLSRRARAPAARAPACAVAWGVRRATSMPHAPASQPLADSAPALSWNEFLKLRRKRRFISVFTSAVMAVGAVGVGISVVLANRWDTWLVSFSGLDPLAVVPLCVVALAATGWLVGPVFGGLVFRARYSKQRAQMVAKERQFFERIRRHRGDPSNSSINNPIPDYYGEKIGSLTGYRKWLKDQRAFKLKVGRYGKDGEL